METNPKFDVTQAFTRWRNALASTGSLTPEAMRELEGHLRDSMTRLQAVELSEEEAFLVAARRLGTPDALAAEFRQVNPYEMWLNRGIIAILAVLGMNLLFQVVQILATSAQIAFLSLLAPVTTNDAVSSGAPHPIAWTIGPLQSFLVPILLCVCWMFVSRRDLGVAGWFSRIRQHPWGSGLGLIGCSVILHAAQMAAQVVLVKIAAPGSMHQFGWNSYLVMFVSSLYLPMALVWLLRRRLSLQR